MLAIATPQEKLYLFDLDNLDQETKSYEIFTNHKDINILVAMLKNALHYDHITIDLSLFPENSDEETIEALFLLKSSNPANLIIIAQGREPGDPLLSGLVASGIYNFVLCYEKASAYNEMQKCIKGTDLDEVRHYVNVENLNERTKLRFFKTTEPKYNIGVAGVMPRIGTTTQALRLAKHFLETGGTACYCEQNSSGHMTMLQQVYPSVRVNPGYIEYGGVHIYHTSKPSQTAANNIIYDYGSNFEKLQECEIKILVCGCTPWEMVALSTAQELLKDCKNLYFIFSFVSENEQNDVLDFMGTNWTNCHFTGYVPDMFDNLTSEEHAVYSKIFKRKDNKFNNLKITESNNESVPNKSFFNFSKRKKA